MSRVGALRTGIIIPNLSKVLLRAPFVEGVLLLILVVGLFLAYNYLTFSEGRWMLHPDDHDAFIFSRVLLETGHLWYQSPLNAMFDTSAFIPSIEDYATSSYPPNQDPETAYPGLRGWHSPGYYLLLSIGHLLGFQGPFVIISTAGIVSVLFVYLIGSELFSRRAGAIAAVLVGLSPSVVYWSNMLFSNVLALSFFLGGIYLLIRWQKTGQARLSFLALALLIIGVWVRYDFVIPAVIILGVFFGSGLVTGRLPRRLLIELAAFSLIPVILLLVFNYETAGSIVAVTRGDPSQTATELFWKGIITNP